MHVNCLDPVLIVNPQIYEISLKSDIYYIDGVKHNITCDQKYDILHDVKPSKVLDIPYAHNLSQSYLDSLSTYDREKCLNRLDNFIESCFFVVSETGETFPMYQFVPCGHCDCCHQSLLNSYIQRCQFQIEQDKVPAYFVTLTYNDKHLPDQGHASIDHIKKFKRKFSKQVGKPLKYFCVSEYGSKTDRVHYHILIFGIPYDLGITQVETDRKVMQLVQYCWREPVRHSSHYGYVTFEEYLKEYPQVFYRKPDYDPYSFGYSECSLVKSTASAASYVVKYVGKDFDEKEDRPVVRSISINMGLDFVNELIKQPHKQGKFTYVPFAGKEPKDVSLCGYYLGKVFPSLSKLIDKKYRDAAYNLYDSCYTIVNDPNIGSQIKKPVLAQFYAMRQKYQFLFDFSGIHYDLNRKPKSFESTGHDEALRFNLKVYFVTFYDSLKILDECQLNYEEILKKLIRRFELFNEFVPNTRSQLYQRALRFKKDLSEVQSLSKL